VYVCVCVCVCVCVIKTKPHLSGIALRIGLSVGRISASLCPGSARFSRSLHNIYTTHQYVTVRTQHRNFVLPVSKMQALVLVLRICIYLKKDLPKCVQNVNMSVV